MRNTASDSEAGFTLLEIVMVITLMAVLSGIFISHAGFSISMPEDRILLTQQENLIRARTAHLQTEAILMKRDCTLTLTSTGMTYGDGCRPMPGDGSSVPYLEGVAMAGDRSAIKADKNGILTKADKNGILQSAVEVTLQNKSASLTFKLTEGVKAE